MDHFTVLTDDLKATCGFYSMIGLRQGARPDFPVGGAWFYAGGHAVLHVIETDEMPAHRRGALDHMAFYGQNAQQFLTLLREKEIPYLLIRVPRPYSTWQVFFDDPNGVQVEIDFDADEEVPKELRQGGKDVLR